MLPSWNHYIALENHIVEPNRNRKKRLAAGCWRIVTEPFFLWQLPPSTTATRATAVVRVAVVRWRWQLSEVVVLERKTWYPLAQLDLRINMMFLCLNSLWGHTRVSLPSSFLSIVHYLDWWKERWPEQAAKSSRPKMCLIATITCGHCVAQ